MFTVYPSTAPSAPLNVTAVNTSSTSILVEWEPPEILNGIVRTYFVTFYPSDNVPSSNNVSVNGTTLSADIVDLFVYTSYTVFVVAVTTQQGDESERVDVLTDEDGL